MFFSDNIECMRIDTFFYRRLGFIVFSLRFLPKIKHLLRKCQTSDLSFSIKIAYFWITIVRIPNDESHNSGLKIQKVDWFTPLIPMSNNNWFPGNQPKMLKTHDIICCMKGFHEVYHNTNVSLQHWLACDDKYLKWQAQSIKDNANALFLNNSIFHRSLRF